MDKLKRIVCILLALCFTVAFTSCADKPSQEGTPPTQDTENAEKESISVLSLNKEYVTHHEWYEDCPEMLVRSEYSTVVLDESLAEKYPSLAKTLSETSVMRKKSMKEEKANLLADATKEFLNGSEVISPYFSTLDVIVRRADEVAVSILEDYYSDFGRIFNGLNYDTESGNLLNLSDVITDTSELPGIVEKIIMTRIGEEEPFGETAVADYFGNTSQEDINWTLDYNGVTFYFNAGAIAPTNFGVQTATVTFAEYPGLFNEKYTDVPDAYIVGLPLNLWSVTDIESNKQADGIFVTGDYDEGSGIYSTLCAETGESHYETKCTSYGLEPYYVKTADGNSFLYVFSRDKADEIRETTLSIFSLNNDEVKLLDGSQASLLYRGNNIFALPTDPDKLLLNKYDEATNTVFSVNENGVPVKSAN